MLYCLSAPRPAGSDNIIRHATHRIILMYTDRCLVYSTAAISAVIVGHSKLFAHMKQALPLQGTGNK